MAEQAEGVVESARATPALVCFGCHCTSATSGSENDFLYDSSFFFLKSTVLLTFKPDNGI